MSENRFAECLTVRAVLRTFRNLQLIDADDQDDASARIRELTPPPTVTEEARERARAEARKWWDEPVIVVADDYASADKLADRVIDALGYTPAPTVTPQGHKPYHCTVCYTTGHSKDGKCVNGHDVNDTSTPALPPVVDLAPDELRWLAAVVEDYEKLYNDASRVVDIDTLPPSLELRLVDAGLPAKVVCGENCWVLRIGGTDE